MITYKSNDDFMNMKKAGKIVSTIHSELENMSSPGNKDRRARQKGRRDNY